MTHLTEEQLILYFFDELDAPKPAGVHLDECSVCRSELSELKRTLNLAGSVQPPPRGPDYGEQVWNRIKPRLAMERTPASRSGWEWMVVAAAAACLIIGAFLLGRWSSQPAPELAVAREGTGDELNRRLLLVTLGDHFEQSQRLLTELANTEGTSFGAELTATQDLLASNRLYRLSAERSGDPGMAILLDKLERILIEIAHAQPVQLGEMQRRIREGDILFQLRVVNASLQQRQRMLPVTSN